MRLDLNLVWEPFCSVEAAYCGITAQLCLESLGRLSGETTSQEYRMRGRGQAGGGESGLGDVLGLDLRS